MVDEFFLSTRPLIEIPYKKLVPNPNKRYFVCLRRNKLEMWRVEVPYKILKNKKLAKYVRKNYPSWSLI